MPFPHFSLCIFYTFPKPISCRSPGSLCVPEYDMLAHSISLFLSSRLNGDRFFDFAATMVGDWQKWSKFGCPAQFFKFKIGFLNNLHVFLLLFCRSVVFFAPGSTQTLAQSQLGEKPDVQTGILRLLKLPFLPPNRSQTCTISSKFSFKSFSPFFSIG